ncbi:MAG: OmpH family outer membrane protein [Proteobacteria bacterium]|nr:OmpH family outer membrane protein [Burkholderiales bacterium]
MGLCIALVASSSVWAQASDLRIGFVDTERILREATPAVRAQKRLEKDFAPRDQELQRLAARAKELQVSLEKDGVTLSESERGKREQDLARITQQFQRLQREFREDLNIRRNEEMATVLERVNAVIKKIAELDKLDLVFQEAVFRSSRIDITEKVLKALAASDK